MITEFGQIFHWLRRNMTRVRERIGYLHAGMVHDVLKKNVQLIVTENDADLSSTRGKKRCVIR